MKIKFSQIIIFMLLVLFNNAFANNSFSLENATVSSVEQAFQTHQISCEQLINDYISRIKQYDLSVSKGAPINAIVQINPYAIDEARALDKQYASTQQLVGPLHCIPVILKDNIDSYDTQSTEGTLAMLGNQPVSDAFVTQQLRRAGAIILAKGGMDELASGISGISSRIGRIGNAYDPNQNPGGSSGGVAAAISANFAIIGIGTDNSGSIRIPAAYNGLNGIRSSTGLISQRGIFPLGNLDGVAGPLTRNMQDLAIVMNVIATQDDPQDPKTKKAPRIKSYSDLLNDKALQGKRIGIVKSVAGSDTFNNMPSEAQQVFEGSLASFKNAGAIIIDNIDLPKFDNDRKLNMAGTVDQVNQYLNSYPATRKSFNDICKSDRTRIYGKNIRACLKFLHSIASENSSQSQQVLARFDKNRKYVELVMQQNHLDALLLPITTHGTATYDNKTLNVWSNNAGIPSVVVNAGYVNGMPFGIELVGKSYSEAQLIAMAYAYQKHSQPLIEPTMPIADKRFEKYSISQMNNLFTLIGSNAYDKVLKNNKEAALTPAAFHDIVVSTI